MRLKCLKCTALIAIAITLCACASLQIPPLQNADSTLLAFPYKVINESDSGGAPGFKYIYTIENMDGLVEPIQVALGHRLDGDLLIVDSLPPGTYRVSKISVVPLGAGSHSYDDNSTARNDQFQLDAGKLTVFSQELKIRKYNPTPGRGRSIVFERSINPVTVSQRNQITETLLALPNSDQWELQFAVAGKTSSLRAPTPGPILAPAPATTAVKQDGDLAIAGRYRSQISSDSDYVFPRRFQRTEITLSQEGNRISGVDESGEFQISGEIDGDIVRFYLQPTIATGYYDVTGEWEVQEGAKILTGFWKDSRGDGPGQWQLTKIK